MAHSAAKANAAAFQKSIAYRRSRDETLPFGIELAARDETLPFGIELAA